MAARRNYTKEATLLCARDLEAHLDSADGFWLDDTEPYCSEAESRAFRLALCKVVQRLYRTAGIDWDYSTVALDALEVPDDR